MASVCSCFLVIRMECGLVSHLMTILEKSSLHEEIREEDHHENVVFLSIDIDTGESAKSTALGAATLRTRETAIVGGLKYSSNIGWNRRSNHLLVVEYKVVDE
ncbi:hypothetical protein Tco_1127532 [Tanacetum coccineum]